jgi:arylsulfatase A-like enzyme
MFMKAIMVMFDSLNRHMLPPYGGWIKAPNFQRLAEKSVVFDSCFVGSMPCMPARRELHTGRHNFLHRSWGPLEPFDDSMPEILKGKGVYTHLVTDHQHYWEDGGATYHNRYNSYEFIRGQEGDPWKGEIKDPQTPDYMGGHNTGIGGHSAGRMVTQDWINRQYIREEAEFPQAQTFEKGLAFIRQNEGEDNWFLQLETFDPHEPFFAHQKYRELYPHNYEGKHFDWPPYRRIEETPEEVEHCRYEYAALVSMCDHYLGKVLDLMDEKDLWKDTMLIVNSDHGFLLGEHDWWAKNIQPFYNEIARPPLFIWDPRCGKTGERRNSLVQMIDIAPTLLDFFNVDIPEDMMGKSLKETIAADQSVRSAALFGIHGGHINCTDGRYVYMKAPATPENKPIYNYTLMPSHMRCLFSVDELMDWELEKPFRFTKQLKTMKISANPHNELHQFGTLLFDMLVDPEQQSPIKDEQLEAYMTQLMIQLMKENDTPAEQYERVGLSSGNSNSNGE